jgi:hypothetical protein
MAHPSGNMFNFLREPSPVPVPVPAPGPGIAKIKSICDKVTKDISEADADPVILSISSSLNEAIGLACDLHKKPEPVRSKYTQMVSLGTINKRPRRPNQAHSDLLLELCDNLNLSDPFRILYPDVKEYTYVPRGINKKNRSQIDFLLDPIAC